MNEGLSERKASTGAPPQGEARPPVLHIQALGVPEVCLGDVPLRFPTRKALALLLYLAVTATPQSREHLAALFWPDRDDERARATLRSTLRLLRQTLADVYAELCYARSDNNATPSEPGGRHDLQAATWLTDLWVRGGHDRLGRDSLWLNRPFESQPSTASPAPGVASAAERARAQVTGGVQGSVGVVVRLDVEALEQATALATRLSPRHPPGLPASPGATAGGERGTASDELGQQMQHLTSAVAVCRGPFLAGFSLADSDAFAAWVEQQRAYWQGRMDRVFEALSRLQLERGAFAAALETAGRWMELNPLEEAGYRRLMEAHGAAGDRTAALAAYARGRETLARTLGVEPAPETVALAERIRRQTMPSETSGAQGAGARLRGASATASAAPRTRRTCTPWAIRRSRRCRWPGGSRSSPR